MTFQPKPAGPGRACRCATGADADRNQRELLERTTPANTLSPKKIAPPADSGWGNGTARWTALNDACLAAAGNRYRARCARETFNVYAATAKRRRRRRSSPARTGESDVSAVPLLSHFCAFCALITSKTTTLTHAQPKKRKCPGLFAKVSAHARTHTKNSGAFARWREYL